MRHLIALFALLLLAPPLAAQQVNRCTRLATGLHQCRVPPDTVRKIDTVRIITIRTDTLFIVDTIFVGVPDSVKPIPPDTTPPPPPDTVIPPPSGGLIPELPAGYTLRMTWSGSPAPPSGWPIGWAGNPAGSVSVVSDATAPASPPNVAAITYPSGFRSGNEPQTWEYTATNGASGVVLTYWFKYSSGFDGEQSSINKHIFLFSSSGGVVGYTAARFSGAATTGYIDFLYESGTIEWLATSKPSIRLDTWHRVTVEIGPTTRLWVDGALVGTKTRSIPTIGVMKVAPTWGGNTGDVMSGTGRLYLDELQVRTK